MDIYANYLNKPTEIINVPDEQNMRPFLITKNEVTELEYARGMYGMNLMCWEANIITQIWANKYGWFDRSKNLIDIGAGAGEYPIFAGFKYAYAFEPNKVKRCLIHANMLSYDKIDDIDVIPYAISDNPGVREFTGWSEDVTNLTSENPEVLIGEYRTLDSFNIDNVGLIKIDIEGYEFHALNSGIETIKRSDYPPLLIEVWNPKDILAYFKDKFDEYYDRQCKLLNLLDSLGYVRINDPSLGDWETFFFIHQSHLNGYENPKES